MSEEQKPFKRIELQAMMMLASANTAIILEQIGTKDCPYKNEKEAQLALEGKLNELIDWRWNCESKSVS